MRILPIAISLVAVVYVAAQSTPDQEVQAYFALAQHAGIVSEVEFYGHLLHEFDPITPYNIIIPTGPTALTSPAKRCKNSKDKTESMFTNFVRTLGEIQDVVPISDYIRNYISMTTHDITQMLHDGWHSYNLVGIRTALDALHFLLRGLASMPISILNDTMGSLSNTVKSTFEGLCSELSCSLFHKEAIEEAAAPAQCFELAYFYHGAVANTLEHLPVRKNMSAEVILLVKRSTRILRLMDNSSITAMNDDIMKALPISGTAELLQYHDELLQYHDKLLRQRDKMMLLSDSEEIQKYAAGALSVIISSSNALRACISIAADIVKIDEGPNEVNEEVDEMEDED